MSIESVASFFSSLLIQCSCMFCCPDTERTETGPIPRIEQENLVVVFENASFRVSRGLAKRLDEAVDMVGSALPLQDSNAIVKNLEA